MMDTIHDDYNDTYIVVWVNQQNETQGRGEPMPKHVAELICAEFNKRYPHILHTAVLASEVTAP